MAIFPCYSSCLRKTNIWQSGLPVLISYLCLRTPVCQQKTDATNVFSLKNTVSCNCVKDTAFKHSKVTGDNCMVKQYKYGLHSKNEGFNKGSFKILKVLRRTLGFLELKMAPNRCSSKNPIGGRVHGGTALVGGGYCRNLTAQLKHFDLKRQVHNWEFLKISYIFR